MEDVMMYEKVKNFKKTAFKGNFELDDFQIEYHSGVGNATFTITDHPCIEFTNKGNSAENEPRIKLTNFLEKTLEKAFSSGSVPIVAQQTETGEAIMARITEHSFLVENFNNQVLLAADRDTAILGFNCAVQGKIYNNSLFLNFEIILPDNNGNSISISGKAAGSKQ